MMVTWIWIRVLAIGKKIMGSNSKIIKEVESSELDDRLEVGNKKECCKYLSSFRLGTK